MKYELWHSESECSYTLLKEGDRSAEHLKEADARVICVVEAETYEEALQKRNDFLGWGEYKSNGLVFDYPDSRRR
jgi:hypothetical protein